MYQQQREPVKTTHLYVVPEKESIEYTEPISIPRIINSILSALFMAFLLTVPASVDISARTILVPIHYLPIQTFVTTVAIVPTGIQTIPATPAHGYITGYNGSFLVQQIPKGFIVTTQGGTEIITDEAATVPPGNPPVYGMTRIPAHAVVPGSAGNIPALNINETYGTALYLKNLTPFSGGADAYTVPFATDTDRTTALTTAHIHLRVEVKTNTAMLDKPCGETATQNDLALTVSWSCQFVTYPVPTGTHVLSVERRGNAVLLVVQHF